jgi:hypothetical protein
LLTTVHSVLLVLTRNIVNNCSQCTVGGDTFTSLTTVHSVLLVLTLLHS